MIDTPARPSHAHFARQILQAIGRGRLGRLGLAPVAGVAALAVGCGGNVVLDQGTGGGAGNGGAVGTGNGGAFGTGGAPGSGGAGAEGVGGSSEFTSTAAFGSTAASSGTATSGGSTGAGGATGFVCDVSPPSGDTFVYGCMSNPPTPCPSLNDPAVFDNLSAILNDPNGCGSGQIVQQILCGPDPDPAVPDTCCYDVAMGPVLCEGRPFTVDGAARTAPAVARAGFSAPVTPDVSRLDPATRRALAAAWERDARYEHASIASFARFTLELLAAGAPADLLAGAHRALGDEIRHAELCFGLAGAYAGAALGPGPLPMAGALAGRDDLATIAVAAVDEGCIGETLAALVADAQRDAAEDPAVRAALARIAADEAAHAALAWRFVAWAVAEGPAEVGSAVAAAFARAAARTHAPSADAPPAGADPAAMRAHGRLPEREVQALAAQAWSAVIAPCARALGVPQA